MKVMARGYGGESKNETGPSGNLIVHFNVIDLDPSKYVLQGNNILQALNVSYVDAILGKQIDVVLPDNTKHKIKIPEYSDNGTRISINGKGISGADYIFVVQVELPKTIDKDTKKYLEKIQKINNK